MVSSKSHLFGHSKSPTQACAKTNVCRTNLQMRIAAWARAARPVAQGEKRAVIVFAAAPLSECALGSLAYAINATLDQSVRGSAVHTYVCAYCMAARDGLLFWSLHGSIIDGHKSNLRYVGGRRRARHVIKISQHAPTSLGCGRLTVTSQSALLTLSQFKCGWMEMSTDCAIDTFRLVRFVLHWRPLHASLARDSAGTCVGLLISI